jgi:hypothetical protein
MDPFAGANLPGAVPHLFPAGIFLGLAGVSLWLFFYLGAVAT